MKRILFFIMMMMISSLIAKAQIVDIPDEDFKQLLLTNSHEGVNLLAFSADDLISIDANEDGEIQVSEALVVDKMLVDGYNHPGMSLEGIQAFSNLTLFHIDEVNLDNEDFSGLSNLEDLKIVRCDINNLNITGLSSLQYLDCWDNDLTELDCTGLMSLLGMSCTKNNITVLDVSSCPQLTSLAFNENPLEYLNIKNGLDTSFYFTVTEETPFLTICADEGEISIIQEFFTQEANSDNFYVTSYCTIEPGGNYNMIEGFLTLDLDGNGCTEDEPFGNLIKMGINGQDSGSTFANSGGYRFYTQQGTFTITPEFENDWFVAAPPSATVTLAAIDNSTTTQDFCLTANGVHPDLGVLIMPVVPSQPGFDAVYQIVYFNKGNQIISGNVFFSFDDARMDYVSASPAEDFTSGNIRGWDYTDLMPFQSRSVLVTLNVNSPQEDPAVNIGDILPFSVTVTPTTGDETPDDNQFLYDETVTGSFDPNDITCLEGEVAGPDMIGEYLHYNINFENTGDAAAAFIVVKQVIDEAQYDLSTLQVINTSHDVKVKVEENIVEYRFDDINLGPLEKGNIVFKIKSLNSLQVGDDVMQKAEIFFDYNWPIVTNEAVTVFEVLGTRDYEFDNTVQVYPNPVKNNLNITAGHIINSIELYDLQGRLLQTTIVKGTDATINLSGRAAGVYFVKVATERGVKVEKIINE